MKYCCDRFKESVEEDQVIAKASGFDETEWYIVKGGHIYYCPFCGVLIKVAGLANTTKGS